MLRKTLIWLRRQYNTNLIPAAKILGLALVVLIAASFLVDIYLPPGAPWNFLRTIIMVPLAAVLYSLGYAVGLFLHYARMETGEWIPYRLRFSLAWRQRMGLLAAAVLMVFMYATGAGPGYTLMASSYVALAFAVLAFVRATPEESLREELSIPDARDVRYSAEVKARTAARRGKAQEKLEKKNQSIVRKALKNL